MLYFLYIPSFNFSTTSAISYVNMVSFLNLAVVGLLLSTFTTRFVFPMISLEGRRFWILGQLGCAAKRSSGVNSSSRPAAPSSPARAWC